MSDFAGIGDIIAERRHRERARELGKKLARDELEKMKQMLQDLQVNLRKFAEQHRDEILSNSEFRTKFQKMCDEIGIDPLASRKSAWSSLGVGDFYFQLAVQCVDVCVATRAQNGGLMDLEELQRRVNRLRGPDNAVSFDDLERAIKSLAPLGGGFQVLRVGNRRLVQSVPAELSSDSGAVVGTAQNNAGAFTIPQLTQPPLSFHPARAQAATETLVRSGTVWVDDQNPDGITVFYVVALWNGLSDDGVE
ncbi:winged helix DNA-binding domain-containing protein [Gonapodya prolifera JEL478]|uniref:Winged helix DNA-binding domain-containing protein n=1 Tax=Gonapodya prolifera (strain JEL478) TaxID=1344416 RepID=A0A139AIK3_GONPJ|nr:winged helix DNA-binding domain-containing protein [Gonapodya prolifera JEL478]|eukprot:KXS16641.1 winged helix DNA-binding domain-containing protein [Gonapodya prolifera JEL478]